MLSFCEKIYLGKNIEGTKILFSEGGNEVIQGTNGQTQGSYSSNAAQYITNDRVGVVAQQFFAIGNDQQQNSDKGENETADGLGRYDDGSGGGIYHGQHGAKYDNDDRQQLGPWCRRNRPPSGTGR